MNAPAPRLRTDLIVSRQQTAGGTVFVIKDPVSGGFFRLGEMERFIAEQLDGETGLDVVQQRTEARFAGSLTAGSLDAFVQRLERAHLLENGDATTRKRSRLRRRARLRGSLLYLRLPLLDPDRILDRLVHRVRLCFATPFLVFSAAVILVAAGITIANWSELAQSTVQLYRLEAIPLLLIVAFIVGSAHEFAHGVTCKHFGGKVPEMGFLLLYFQPALYTNVSDAWLFPEKSKRLWVSLAGPYFELFLWGIATLAWRLAEMDTWISSVAVTVMTVSGIRCLLNFNPFIKLDGYYLLSDYLNIPNLRRKSFAYLGGAMRRLLGLASSIAPHVARRERRVYLGYGAVATVFSLALLGYVVVTAGAFFIEMRQPTALALLTGLVGIKSRHRFRNLFGAAATPDASDPALPPPSPAALAPEEAAHAPKKRKHRARSTRRAVWAALAVAALALVLLGRMQLRIGGSFVVLPEENADVRAEVDGIVEDIAVDEGDSVQAGDVVARLSNHALEAELPKTEAAIRETRAQMRKLETGPTVQEIALARASVSRVEDRLRYARTNAARLASLFATAAVTRQELEAAQELATTAENDLAEAKGRMEALLVRTRPEDIEAMRARLQSLETQQRFLAGEVRELTVVSPVSGIVATPSRQLKEMEGQLVGRGLLIAKVYDFGAVMAQIVVSEKDIADVQVGQPVVLRVRAYPNSVFHGTVTAIATAAEGTPGAPAQAPLSGAPGGAIPGRAFIVTTRIDNRGRVLKPGMTGYAKVLGGQRRIAALIARRLARTLKVEVWSWW